MNHAIDFMRDALKSGAYLYREVALSAFELFSNSSAIADAISSGGSSANVRVSFPTRP